MLSICKTEFKYLCVLQNSNCRRECFFTSLCGWWICQKYYPTQNLVSIIIKFYCIQNSIPLECKRRNHIFILLIEINKGMFRTDISITCHNNGCKCSYFATVIIIRFSSRYIKEILIKKDFPNDFNITIIFKGLIYSYIS